MDNTSNQQHETNPGDRPAEETSGAHAKAQPETPNRVLDSVCSAMRKAAGDARDAAEKAIPKVKSAAADAAYWMAYGVSFAAVFQWTVAKSLTPECLKAGYRDGVKAGRESGEKWLEKLRQRQEEATAPSPLQPDPAAAQAQPGTA